MIKRVLAIYGFTFACLGPVFALTAYWEALNGKPTLLKSGEPITTILAINGFTWVMALYEPIGEAPWQPVLRVTKHAVWIARSLLLAAVLLVTATLIDFRSSNEDNLFLAFSMSCLVLEMLSLAVYFGFRPTNIYPASWVRSWNSPNQFLVRIIKKQRVRRRQANRRARMSPPQH